MNACAVLLLLRLDLVYVVIACLSLCACMRSWNDRYTQATLETFISTSEDPYHKGDAKEGGRLRSTVHTVSDCSQFKDRERVIACNLDVPAVRSSCVWEHQDGEGHRTRCILMAGPQGEVRLLGGLLSFAFMRGI